MTDVALLLAFTVLTASILLGLASGGSIALELRSEAREPPAVVVQTGTFLRQGRGEEYEPVLRQALGPGVEVVILTNRGDWSEVRLANQQTGWIPNTAILRVIP